MILPSLSLKNGTKRTNSRAKHGFINDSILCGSTSWPEAFAPGKTRFPTRKKYAPQRILAPKCGCTGSHFPLRERILAGGFCSIENAVRFLLRKNVCAWRTLALERGCVRSHIPPRGVSLLAEHFYLTGNAVSC